MPVEKIGEHFCCNVCGNEVSVSKVGGGTLICCGAEMELVETEEEGEEEIEEESVGTAGDVE